MTKKEQQFIELLDQWELDIFSIQSLKRENGIDLSEWKSPLRQLIKSGYIKIIERGKYCRHYFNDTNVIAGFLVSDGAISYWSALNEHGLTEQFPNKVFVQCNNWKKEKLIFGVRYKFIEVPSRKKVGIEVKGYGNHQYRITDREKTIVDCFDLPQYSGGWPELLRAVAEGDFDQNKFIVYCQAIDNIAATKRLAYLVELMSLPNMDKFLTYAQSIVRKKYNVFDPFGKNEGPFDKKWKLRLNIPEEDLLEIIGKVY